MEVFPVSKKIIAILTIVTILFVCIFASCEKNDEDDIYIDDKEYDFVTDEDGERVLDKDGRFLIYAKDEKGKYVTDASGEKVTEAKPFEALENDGVVEDYGYKITLPEGWKSTQTSGKFENTSTKQSAELTPVESVYSEYRSKAYYLYEQAKEGDIKTTWKDEVDLGDDFKNACRLTLASEDMISIIYVFENSGNTYKIIFTSPESEQAFKDSVAFAQNIEFKPYQYFEDLTSATTEAKK